MVARLGGILRPLCALGPLCAVAVLLTSAVAAQDFPSKPVRVIVQTAAGSSLDVMARVVADHLSAIWKQQIVITNQAGAGGVVAARATAASAPDGYTLFMAGSSVFAVLPVIQTNLPFDVNEFVPIGFVGEQPFSIIVSPSLGVNSIQELVALAKKTPEGLNTVAGTRGGLQHLTAEWFRLRTGANMNMVHYPGSAQAINDTISGRVPVMVQTLSPVAGLLGSGQLKLLAIASEARLSALPDVPTVSETVPGFVSTGWSVLVAPRGTSAPLAQKINADLRNVLERPDLNKRFEELGTFTRPMSPQQLADFIRKERDTWRPIVQKIGIEK